MHNRNSGWGWFLGLGLKKFLQIAASFTTDAGHWKGRSAKMKRVAPIPYHPSCNDEDLSLKFFMIMQKLGKKITKTNRRRRNRLVEPFKRVPNTTNLLTKLDSM